MENMTITEKYSSVFARNYKDKLNAECEGLEWTPPLPDVSQENNEAFFSVIQHATQSRA